MSHVQCFYSCLMEVNNQVSLLLTSQSSSDNKSNLNTSPWETVMGMFNYLMAFYKLKYKVIKKKQKTTTTINLKDITNGKS